MKKPFCILTRDAGEPQMRHKIAQVIPDRSLHEYEETKCILVLTRDQLMGNVEITLLPERFDSQIPIPVPRIRDRTLVMRRVYSTSREKRDEFPTITRRILAPRLTPFRG